ncbi:MAG: protein kinase [Planctomycetes bacterium]|nr:protein kinase [Planctomycetota bacterium]
MQPRIDDPRPPATDSARDQAQRAAAEDALIQRVAELEETVAAERAQHAARAKEVEAGVAVLRRTMQQLQEETRRRRDENARLVEQLEQSRVIVEERSATGQPAGPDAATADALEAALADADQARRDAEVLVARIASIEDELIARDNELTRAADRIAELESRVAASYREPTAQAAAPLATVGRLAPKSPARFETDEDLLTDDSPEAASSPVELAPKVPTPDASAPAATTASAIAAPSPLVPASGAPKTTAADHAAAARRNDEEHLAAAPAAAQDPSFPQIAGLRVERLVEETASGSVYEAREIESRRAVVVRILPGVMKLLDGKRLDSVLLAKHPNLVSVLGFAVCRQGPYLVMERDEGESAADWVARLGTLPERIALSVILEIARGLRQAAFHGAFHGDLSPDSVLIDVAGRVRVRGVGLRVVLSPNDGSARAPEFASTERLRGSPPPDVRADLYSLGAVLFFLLTGKPPFAGERDALLRQHAANSLPDVRESRPDVSDDTAKLLRRLLASDPDLRPQTWDQLLVELERRVPGRVSTALRGNMSTRARRFVVANPWVLGAAVGGLLLVAGIWRVALSHDPSASERFRAACVTAEKLAAAGDPEEARGVYRRFLAGTGDADVEREAARRFDELKK